MLIESSRQERHVPGGRTPARVILVDLTGDLDPASVAEVEAVIVAEIAAIPAAVLVDLRRVTHLDSIGLDCLLRARAAAGTCHVAFGIRSGEGPAYNVLAHAGVGDVLGLVDGPDGLLEPFPGA